MTDSLYADVDRYLSERLLPADPDLDQALADSAAAGLPAINVAPNQGKLLQLLAQATGARRILEVGTLGGYSTIWLARALPADGRLVTLEVDPRHAEVARVNLARAGVGDLVDVRVGPALQTLPTLAEHGPFDFVFIDADKAPTTEYFQHALGLSRSGTVIVVDNVVRKGAILDAHTRDESVAGMRRFFDALAAETRVDATAVQTVGSKGHDGFALAVVQ